MNYQILLIEDDESQREILEEMLPEKSEISISVVSACNGIEALELCKNQKVDAVITDFFMPKMDGLEFIKKFRENESHSEIPIIFMSGYFDGLGAANHKEDLENVTFVNKPFSVFKLCDALKFNLLAKSAKA